MATIKDIAALTNVSPTTVSNVIHGRAGRVSPETVKKIEKAIADLGYTPNLSARSLVSHSSKVIAMINHVITKRDKNFMDDPFNASFVGIIESVLRDHGYYLMVRTVETPEELVSFLRNWNVDGIFITGIFKDMFYDTLSNLSMPVVLIDSYVHSPNFCNVGLEDFKGSCDATEYLIKKGHKRIAFTSPIIKDKGVLQERYLGYRAALTQNKIPFDSSIVFEYEMDLDSCKSLAKELIKDPSITALVTTADIMAAGVMTALGQLGKKVPEDLSIIGFDDMLISQMVTPALTTIHQDMHKKGQLAVEFMIDKLEKKSLSKTEVILPTSLVERESVKDLNQS
ncbi:MAG: LacI family transcriptional regulator [Pseudobutyrivibrio sp.]|nr:LacI family transcriptional regulator [Pseudobutyrivibrio sp.]